MKKIITITTDFGDQFATSQLRAVVASLGFEGEIIENHSVTPYSIIEGAFEIETLSEFTPAGSVHLGVVDPGVGSSRWGVVIKTKNGFFVGPNNGLLYPAASKNNIISVWKIEESYFGLVARTFHGRDVFIKVAVLLSQNQQPSDFGCIKKSKKDLIKLEFQNGQILHQDKYGNIKIYWQKPIAIGEIITLKLNDVVHKIPVVNTFADVAALESLFYWGSSNTLELAINLGDAASFFSCHVGDVLNISSMMRGGDKNVKDRKWRFHT